MTAIVEKLRRENERLRGISERLDTLIGMAEEAIGLVNGKSNKNENGREIFLGVEYYTSSTLPQGD